MRILITGANGQIGHCLQQQLSKRNWDYLALTRAELDIVDPKAVNRIVQRFCPDVIINTAAYTAVDRAEKEQDLVYAINRDGASNLAREAKQINSAILHISTDYVFSGDAIGAYDEGAPTNPQNVYGQSKLESEQAVITANNKHIILRTGWVFGEHGNNFVKTMIRMGRIKGSLNIVDDQEGSPTYAHDIAEALLAIVQHHSEGKSILWGTYHYSGLPYISWFGFAEKIFSEIERAGLYSKSIPQLNAITTAEYPTPAKRPLNSKLDCGKFEREFGISPSDWRSALKNIKAYVE
jgi:dTDP-4-dehydrorhamnose reductase